MIIFLNKKLLPEYGNFMEKEDNFEGTIVLYGYLILKC